MGLHKHMSIKCLTIVQAIAGNFHAFLNFFLYILVAGIYVTRTVKRCLQFVYIFTDLFPVKCQIILAMFDTFVSGYFPAVSLALRSSDQS
jgi:hypothetical protein